MKFRRKHPKSKKSAGPPEKCGGGMVRNSISGGSVGDEKYKRGGHMPFSLKPVNPGKIVTNAQGGAFVIHDDP